MKEYTIPVTWQVISNIKVTAKSLEEAVAIASRIDSQEELPDGKYVQHSFEVQEEFLGDYNTGENAESEPEGANS